MSIIQLSGHLYFLNFQPTLSAILTQIIQTPSNNPLTLTLFSINLTFSLFSYLTKILWFIIQIALINTLHSILCSFGKCQPWLNLHLLCTCFHCLNVTGEKHKVKMSPLTLNLWQHTSGRLLSNNALIFPRILLCYSHFPFSNLSKFLFLPHSFFSDAGDRIQGHVHDRQVCWHWAALLAPASLLDDDFHYILLRKQSISEKDSHIPWLWLIPVWIIKL